MYMKLPNNQGYHLITSLRSVYIKAYDHWKIVVSFNSFVSRPPGYEEGFDFKESAGQRVYTNVNAADDVIFKLVQSDIKILDPLEF